MAAKGRKARVLVVDDSAAVRETLREIIDADADLETLGTASNPYAAARLIAKEVPDVILLDVEMPHMDGLTFLRKIMEQRPIPVVMCASLADGGAERLMEALEAGAVDVIQKPPIAPRDFLLETRLRVCDALKAAARARLHARPAPPPTPIAAPSGRDQERRLGAARLSADVILPPPSQRHGQGVARTTDKVVCVGASTGGTEALRVLLESLPADAPGLVIVQHMPEPFTAAFARRLDSLCALTVREAADGDAVMRGQALIAPGNHHTLLKRNGDRYYVEVRDGPLVSRHRPSVDVLFRSAAHYAAANAVGVLLTGMGDDGARGLLEIMESGGYTIAEDESSCVVFGMPREAIKLGAARSVLPLDRIRDDILRACAAVGGA